jgi:RNase P/RNase MRP subunit p29
MSYHPEEFIGKELSIKRAQNKSLAGLSGIIIDETKKTFTITTKEMENKTILKSGCIFTINGQEITGAELEMRPEERIKRR